MSRLTFATLSMHPNDILDFTSLTWDEFCELLEPFDTAFHERMNTWRLDGKPRTKRAYTTYQNCPLPTPEDRLLFILSYLKSNALQVFHGRLFGMRQNKANQWIHILLPVLRSTFATLGDTPSRNLTDLARSLGVSLTTLEAELTDIDDLLPPLVPSPPETEPTSTDESPRLTAPLSESAPLFAMMAPNDRSHAPRMRMHRKIAIAGRKNAIR